tara:strand:+ start:220 stop:969 length:750 start_codon:yes stop_codon:yes gene_type:complete
MEEIYNVIELKKGCIEVIDEHALRINEIKWKFKSESYGGDEGSLKVIQKEKGFNKGDTFGNYLSVFGWTNKRVVYVVETNKIIFNTDSDNLDDILIDGTDDGSSTRDLIFELSKFSIKSFKIGCSKLTESTGMSSMFIKYDLKTKKIKFEEVEQMNGIIHIVNSGHNLKDQIFELAKLVGFDSSKIKFIDWINWVWGNTNELPGLSKMELEKAKNLLEEYPDYQLTEDLYQPIYELSCIKPSILAPTWW